MAAAADLVPLREDPSVQAACAWALALLVMDDGLETAHERDRVLHDLGLGRRLVDALKVHASPSKLQREKEQLEERKEKRRRQQQQQQQRQQEQGGSSTRGGSGSGSSSSSSSSSVTGDRAWESESGFGGGNASHVRKCIRAAAMAFGYDDEAALVADRRFMSIAEARRR